MVPEPQLTRLTRLTGWKVGQGMVSGVTVTPKVQWCAGSKKIKKATKTVKVKAGKIR